MWSQWLLCLAPNSGPPGEGNHVRFVSSSPLPSSSVRSTEGLIQPTLNEPSQGRNSS